MSAYIQRFPGTRWTIVYGSNEGVEAFALEELNRMVQAYLPYVVEVRQADSIEPEARSGHVILVGTPENHPWIADLLDKKQIRLPNHPDGITAVCFPAEENAGRMVVIAARSPQGVLYGVETFNSQILGSQALPEKLSPENLRAALDQLADFCVEDYPRVKERGIWTWGYVIYDYRRLLDHMARLRLNSLTLWNDMPPINADQVIAYAHSRGIQVILGFPWGWGMDYDLSNPADRQHIEEEVLEHYRDKIASLGADGIYFQTLTEHTTTEMGGRSVAAITCEMVNQVAGRLYEAAPGLNIQFGLHATSIQDHFGDLKDLDPRVSIIWEDVGALPYTYIPKLEGWGRSFAKTIQYSSELAALRPGAPFGLVPKGWTNLDWPDEFEHHPQYLLGARAPGAIRRRAEQIQPRWEKINTLWLNHYEYAIAFYQSLLEVTQGNIIAQALIEDGLLEECIQPAAALYAETLWNPFEPPEAILARAQSPYYKDMV